MPLKVYAFDLPVASSTPLRPLNESNHYLIHRPSAVKMLQAPHLNCLGNTFNFQIAHRCLCFSFLFTSKINAAFDKLTFSYAFFNFLLGSNKSFIERGFLLPTSIILSEIVDLGLVSGHQCQSFLSLFNHGKLLGCFLLLGHVDTTIFSFLFLL